MDYRDYAAGASHQSFWFKGKLGLIKFLFSQSGVAAVDARSLKILNVGVGTGEDLALIARYGQVYAVDVEAQALALVPDSLAVEKTCADVCALPYEDNFFDVVVAFDVLEHIDDHEKAAREIQRVLKPGGYFLLTVPAFNWLFSSHDVTLHHYRRYTKKTLRPILSSFTRISLGYWFFLLFFPAALVRLLDRIGLVKSKESWHVTKLDALFLKVITFENWLMKRGIRFPFGLTVYGMCRK